MPYVVKDKIHFLSEASKILSSSLDYNVTLASISQLVVRNIGDYCIIDILDQKGEMQRVTARVFSKSKQEIAMEFFNFPADPKNSRGIYDTAKSGKPTLISKIDNKWIKESSRLPQEQRLVKKLGIKSVIFAPLLSRGVVIGVLTVASDSKEYDQKDVEFFQELAERAGINIDKAQLFSKAQDALRTRDEFLSIASHELRTPLTSILLNIQLILADIRKTKPENVNIREVVKMLEKSEQQGFRLSRLINELLNVSIASTGRLAIEKEPVNLKKLVKDVLGRFEIQLKNSGTKIQLKGDNNVFGNWDRVRIEQVVNNLISNAIKYGGKKQILMDVKKINKNAILTIKDRGIGIKKNELAHIFDRFKRGVPSKSYPGLGVGLYICKQIVEAHNGKITVESTYRKGSTFTVSLPLDQ